MDKFEDTQIEYEEKKAEYDEGELHLDGLNNQLQNYYETKDKILKLIESRENRIQNINSLIKGRMQHCQQILDTILNFSAQCYNEAVENLYKVELKQICLQMT